MKKNFNKKPLIALFVIGLVVAIGGTIAYFSDTINVKNIFGTEDYGTVLTETFTSPTNWTPGTTTDKTFTVTNTGDVDVAVRVKLTGSWVAADGTNTNVGGAAHAADTDTATTLSLNIDTVASNEDDTNKWTEKQTDGYYYYKTKLAPDAVASTLINSVTFNAAVTDSTSCTSTAAAADWDGATNTQTNAGTVTCTTTRTGYDGATYTLELQAETVQYDAYKAAWSLSSDLVSAN